MITRSDSGNRATAQPADPYRNPATMGRGGAEINGDFITALQELLDTHTGRVKGAVRPGATGADRMRGAAAMGEMLVPGMGAAEVAFNTVFPRANAGAPKAHRGIGDTVRSVLSNPFR